MLTKPPAGSNFSMTSVVLWGPPGTGKTTIAKAVANTSGRRFVELSAVSTGVKELREVIDKARTDQELYSVASIVFLDEIHRFSKAQQDALLPAVEAGWIVLIAATTENPSFSVNAPLLSRSLLVKLEPLDEKDIATLLSRAVADPAGLGGKVTLSEEATNRICQIAGGDARRALTVLEAAASRAIEFTESTPAEVSIEDVLASLETALVRYDREGEQHYDTISAFIKSVRGSDVDAAIHYLARMLEGGEDPRFIARRLMILASEDIGLADPSALPLAVAAFETVANIGMPEGRIALSQVTIYLALAPKSNSAYLAINKAIEEVRSGFLPSIPLYLRSSASARQGAQSSYLYPHDHEHAVVSQEYVAEERRYYEPKLLGQERTLAERFEALRAIIRGKRA
jgi:putative ATPase